MICLGVLLIILGIVILYELGIPFLAGHCNAMLMCARHNVRACRPYMGRIQNATLDFRYCMHPETCID
jgi:hypothetical protein